MSGIWHLNSRYVKFNILYENADKVKPQKSNYDMNDDFFDTSHNFLNG